MHIMSSMVQSKKFIKGIIVLAFLLYMCSLIYFLFFSERYGRTETADYYRYNLQPFKEIMRYWRYRDVIGYEMVIINLVGNVGVFIPFGLLLPIIYKPLAKWYALLPVGMMFSIIIECIQLVTRVGTLDADDVILNVTGIMLGLAILNFVYFIRRKQVKPKL